jgi:hypothetical protein
LPPRSTARLPDFMIEYLRTIIERNLVSIYTFATRSRNRFGLAGLRILELDTLDDLAVTVREWNPNH